MVWRSLVHGGVLAAIHFSLSYADFRVNSILQSNNPHPTRIPIAILGNVGDVVA